MTEVTFTPKQLNHQQLDSEMILAGILYQYSARSTPVERDSPPPEHPLFEALLFQENLTPVEITMIQNVVASHIPQPTEYDLATNEWEAHYDEMVTRLQQIQNGSSSYTTTQMQRAIGDIALYLRQTVRYIHRGFQ
jgi:hypothetical protein